MILPHLLRQDDANALQCTSQLEHVIVEAADAYLLFARRWRRYGQDAGGQGQLPLHEISRDLGR